LNKGQYGSHSFVFRIWWEEQETTRTWRGQIHHAPSGEVKYVHHLPDLLAFIETYTGPLAATDTTPSPSTKKDKAE